MLLPNNPSQKGYIALISAIIISFILIAVVFVANTSGYFSRFDSQNGEYKRIALGLAESCANTALLKVAYDPSYIPPVGGETVSVGSQTCTIKSMDNPSTYDSSNKKTIVVFAEGQYQQAFSSVSVASTVLDPNHAPAAHAALTVIVQTVNNYGGTAQPGSFTVDVSANNPTQSTFLGASSGTTVFVEPGAFNITITPLANYHTDYLNSSYPYSCSGTASVNQSYVCIITNTDLPTTFSLTAAANITRAYQVEPLPSDLQLTLSGPVNLSMTSGAPVSNLPQGSFSVSLTGVPSGYTVSPWGEDCAASGAVSWAPGQKRYKTCAINIVEDPPPVSNQAALTIVERVLNYNGGTAQPADFTVNVWAVNPTQTTFPGQDGSGTTILIDPGDFDVTQPALVNYKNPQYLNSGDPYLCAGTAVAGKSYLCLITNYDIASTFTLTPTVNIQRAYGVAPVPSYTLTLSGPPGPQVLTSGVAVSNLPQGAYTISISGIPPTYSVSQWGPSPDCSPTGAVTWSPGDKRYKTCTINIVENPPPFHDIDTVMMLDRTGSMWTNSAYIPDEKAAAKSLLNLFNGLTPPKPYVGVGVFANDSNVSAMIPATGYLTNSYGSETSGSTAAKFPTAVHAPNYWTNASNAFSNDAVYATDATNAHQQGYSTFVLSVPAGAVIDGIEVKGIGKVSSGAGTLGVNLSWNNGGNWSNQKTASLTTSRTPFTLGGAADNWGRTWASGDFSDGNFVLRVENRSTTGITVSLDYITVKVYYSAAYATNLYAAINSGLASSRGGTDLSAAISVSNIELNGSRHISGHKKYLILISDGQPTLPNGHGTTINLADINAAYASADSAKTNKGAANDYVTEIYTIFFGNTVSLPNSENSRDFLAELATGLTLVSGHQPGSHNDTGNSSNLALINLENDDGDNFFIAPTSDKMTEIFNKIGTEIISAVAPPAATKGTLNVITHVINNGGHTKTASDFAIAIGGSNPVPAAFSGAEAPGITVTIDPGTYSVTENTDSDYVETIDPQCSGTISAGQEITCTMINDDIAPIATPPPPPPPPPPSAPPSATNSTIYVITHVINDNGKAKTASDFPITVSGDTPIPSAFAGQGYPGVNVTLNPGVYSVTEPADSDYVETVGQGCSGTITLGQAVTCTIINDDTPPPVPPPPLPPPPPPNIDIGSWQETPTTP